jgi:hypothetical protein
LRRRRGVIGGASQLEGKGQRGQEKNEDSDRRSVAPVHPSLTPPLYVRSSSDLAKSADLARVSDAYVRRSM